MNLFRKNKIILMDIDGVIAPISRIDEPFTTVTTPWSTFIIPNKILPFLSEIINKKGFYWSSSWGDLSNCINSEFDIRDSQFLTFDDNDSNMWLKEKTLVNFCNKNKKAHILIVDDELPSDSELHTLSNVEIITPDPSFGLTKIECDKIEKWLK